MMNDTVLLETEKTEKLRIAVKQENIFKKNFRKLLYEPFVHFLVLGYIIYLLGSYLEKHHVSERYDITVSEKDIYRIASLWEKQYGTVPNEQELQTLIDNFIREEVFYREGLDMKVDKDDEVVRRRVAQKVEFLQQDLNVIEEPKEEELKNFYHLHQKDYASPQKISFTHIYFSTDKAGKENAIERAESLKGFLSSNKVSRAPEKGDHFPFAYDYSDLNQTDLIHLLGESELTSKAMNFPVHQWSGPVTSGYGVHLVYPTAQKLNSYHPFEEVKDKVKTDYQEWIRNKKNEESFEKLKKNYSIKIASLPHADTK